MKARSRKFSSQAHMLAWLALAAAVTGCIETTGSSKVKPRDVQQTYRLSYSDSESALSGTAQFNVAGSAGLSLVLEEPSRVSLDSTRMTEDSFLGTRYILKQPGPFRSEHVFHWIDQEGRPYDNAVHIPSLHVEKASDEMVMNAVYTLQVSGERFSDEDHFFATLEQPGSSGEVNTVEATRLGTDRLSVKFQLNPSRSRAGTARLKLVRSRTMKLVNATESGGSLTAEFQVEPITIKLRKN